MGKGRAPEPSSSGRFPRMHKFRQAFQAEVERRADPTAEIASLVTVLGQPDDDAAETPPSHPAEPLVDSYAPPATTPAVSPIEPELTPTGAATPATPARRFRAPGAAPEWLRHAAGWTWRLLLVSAGVVILAYVITRLKMVFIAFFIALVLTAVLRPLRDVFDRHMRRGFSVLFSLLTAAFVIAALVTFVVVSVVGEWGTVGAQFGTGIQQLLDLVRGPPLHLSIPYHTVADATTALQTWISDHYTEIAGNLWAGVGTATYVIATLALGVFLTAFFLSSGRQMWQWFLTQFPMRNQKRLSLAFAAAFVTFAGYARGQVLISLIDAILAAVLLTALRIPLAIPLAVLVLIGSLIPMIGAPIAMLVAGIVALAADGPIKALIVILGVALIGQIEGHLLEPFLMGHQVNLHPVAIAIAVASGTVLGGILGAVIAVPLVAVGWRVFQVLRSQELPPDAKSLAAPSDARAPAGAVLPT